MILKRKLSGTARLFLIIYEKEPIFVDMKLSYAESKRNSGAYELVLISPEVRKRKSIELAWRYMGLVIEELSIALSPSESMLHSSFEINPGGARGSRRGVGAEGLTLY